MKPFTIVIPYWNGQDDLPRLIESLPDGIPVIIIDDQSDAPVPNLNRANTRVIGLADRGYFAGAVTAGVDACATDVLVLNQDAWFDSGAWLNLIDEEQGKHAIFGEGVMGHPAWPDGYVQGTFMYLDREAWEDVGPMNGEFYPLWGCTCEWQVRACRLGYSALPIEDVPGFRHAEHRRVRWGEAITTAVVREPEKRRWFIRTPPMVSVIVPCYNYANYLPQAIASLIGGSTDLGVWEAPGQTFQSFEVVIVDDASPDNTQEIARRLADRSKGIRYVRLAKNKGTAGAINEGVKRAFGEYIHVLSADDLRRPFTLERLLAGCKDRNKLVAYGNLDIFRNGKVIKRIKLKPYDFDRLLHKNMMPAGIMYPREAWKEVGGYPESMSDGREDWAFNIALGIRGWCGQHIGFSGNLVRREGTNRSIRSAQKYTNARAHFKRKIMGLFPEIYGGQRPVGCCGKGNRSGMPTHTPSNVSGEMTLIKYIGLNDGIMTWDAPSGTRYRFGGSRRMSYVHDEDVNWFINQRKNTRPLFERASEPKPEPEPEPEPTPEPETESEPAPEKETLQAKSDLKIIKGIAHSTERKLKVGGYLTVKEIAEADPKEMAHLANVSEGYAIRYIEGAKRVLERD